MNKQIIFMLDDETSVIKAYTEILSRLLPDCIVYGFDNTEEMLTHEKLNIADLFIVDVELKNLYGWDVMNKVCNMRDKSTTCLFMSGRGYELKNFDGVACTYDFIQKPANTSIFVNRIKVLLQVSHEYKQLEFSRRQVELCLYELFNHTNLYVIVLDEAMEIKMCSWYLAHDLGYERPEDLIGKNWRSFIPSRLREQIENVFCNVRNKVKIVEDFREVTNAIIGKNNKEINVKWFNTVIKNGTELSFSIGIPLSKPVTKEDNVSAIRSYWSDIIENDRTTIDSLKNILKNNPQQDRIDTCLETS